MICPKCGFEQPESPECVRCGIIINRYRGPASSTTPAPASSPPPTPVATLPPPPPPPRPVGVEAARTPDLEPAGAAEEEEGCGGTMYEGPAPSAVPAPASGATSTAVAAMRSFEVGGILGESFTVYFRNFIPFVLLTALTLSPLYLVQAYTEVRPAMRTMSPTAALSALALALVALVCPYIATAAITYGVFQQMRGRDTSIGDCLGRGLASFLPVVLLAIVQGLAIGIGFCFCLIPGVLLALRWAVSIPAAVEERPGVLGAFEALSRSTYLTEGYRAEILGVLFVVAIMNIGAQVLLTLVAAKDPPLFLLLSGLATLLNTGLGATATAVMYYRLRSLKESVDLARMTSVFC